MLGNCGQIVSLSGLTALDLTYPSPGRPLLPAPGSAPTDCLSVLQAVHKAELKMDEKGTEGAAGSGAQTLPMENPRKMRLNKPFLMMIYEKLVPSMIFLARIYDPSEK